MEKQREEIEFVGDCIESVEEAGKGHSLSSKIQTLDVDDANTVEVSDSVVSDVDGTDENLNRGGSATEVGTTANSGSDDKVKTDVGNVEDVVGSFNGEENVEKTVSSDDFERADAVTEPETERNHMACEGDAGIVEVDKVEGSELCNDVQRDSTTGELVDMTDETDKSQVMSKNGASHESAREVESSERTGEKAMCEGEDNSAACDAMEQNIAIEKSQQSSADGETLDVAEDKADQEKESGKKSEEDGDKMDVNSTQAYEEHDGLNEQGNPGSEIKVSNHSEAAQVPEESTQLTKGETNEENSGTVSEVFPATEICREEDLTNGNPKEENGEAMEIGYTAEEQDVTVGGLLDNAGNEYDAAIADAVRNNSSIVKEMEIDEHKDNADTASDLTGTIESADLANPNIPTEDAAPGEVEPLDHNGLFDPSSDITNFIDFSGVSSWSGNIQDLKSETRIVSLKEDMKATDMAEEVAKVGIENESNEAHVALESESPAAATDCSKEASDAILGSENNQEDKDLECLDKNKADQQDTMREEDANTHEAPSTEPNQKEDAEMKENPNNSDYTDEEANSDIKTNGVKRKADVLSEDSPGEGRNTVSLAKVSFNQRPSFKIGECIARAASQMAGSPSVLKGSNFGDETLSIESFVSQLHCAATDPNNENVVSDVASGFFLDYRNSMSQQVTPEKISSKSVKLSNSNAGGTEAFEFEEMGDTYWTDRVIHSGGEEQMPPTAKEDYQIVPVELKPAQVQRTRRPYRRRQSQISIPHSASVKPADFDENAPAELIMNFSETDIIPPEKSLSKMFRHFGPIKESLTEVDKEKNRARVVFKKGVDAEVTYNSAGMFNIFGTKAVKYELNHTITETFKVQPYVVSLGQEDAALCLPS